MEKFNSKKRTINIHRISQKKQKKEEKLGLKMLIYMDYHISVLLHQNYFQ
jgi:hypothetical protein